MPCMHIGIAVLIPRKYVSTKFEESSVSADPVKRSGHVCPHKHFAVSQAWYPNNFSPHIIRPDLSVFACHWRSLYRNRQSNGSGIPWSRQSRISWRYHAGKAKSEIVIDSNGKECGSCSLELETELPNHNHQRELAATHRAQNSKSRWSLLDSGKYQTKNNLVLDEKSLKANSLVWKARASKSRSEENWCLEIKHDSPLAMAKLANTHIELQGRLSLWLCRIHCSLRHPWTSQKQREISLELKNSKYATKPGQADKTQPRSIAWSHLTKLRENVARALTGTGRNDGIVKASLKTILGLPGNDPEKPKPKSATLKSGEARYKLTFAGKQELRQLFNHISLEMDTQHLVSFAGKYQVDTNEAEADVSSTLSIFGTQVKCKSKLNFRPVEFLPKPQASVATVAPCSDSYSPKHWFQKYILSAELPSAKVVSALHQFQLWRCAGRAPGCKVSTVIPGGPYVAHQEAKPKLLDGQINSEESFLSTIALCVNDLDEPMTVLSSAMKSIPWLSSLKVRWSSQFMGHMYSLDIVSSENANSPLEWTLEAQVEACIPFAWHRPARGTKSAISGDGSKQSRNMSVVQAPKHILVVEDTRIGLRGNLRSVITGFTIASRICVL